MKGKALERIEIELLLEGIAKCYGYDFRDYATASLKRRLQLQLLKSSSKTYTELLDKIIHDKSQFEFFLSNLFVSVTEMFRDPEIYNAIRVHVIPVLKTYPFLKIWHAGCATGEEVYSMAIVLHEENLLERAQIYATDIDLHALEIAKEGIYSAEKIQRYTQNYHLSGGKQSFSDYYHAKYGAVKMAEFLKKKMVFAYHNLSVDNSFCEAQMIICRNVLIYFNQHLQDRAINLFNESLSYGGFLFLGSKESLKFSKCGHHFENILPREKLYQKLYPEEAKS